MGDRPADPVCEKRHDPYGCPDRRDIAVPEILVVLLLFIYPFLHGLVLSFEPKEGGGLANYLRFFSQPFLLQHGCRVDFSFSAAK